MTWKAVGFNSEKGCCIGRANRFVRNEVRSTTKATQEAIPVKRPSGTREQGSKAIVPQTGRLFLGGWCLGDGRRSRPPARNRKGLASMVAMRDHAMEGFTARKKVCCPANSPLLCHGGWQEHGVGASPLDTRARVTRSPSISFPKEEKAQGGGRRFLARAEGTRPAGASAKPAKPQKLAR